MAKTSRRPKESEPEIASVSGRLRRLRLLPKHKNGLSFPGRLNFPNAGYTPAILSVQTAIKEDQSPTHLCFRL